MKTLLTRILPLLLCILVGAAASWVSVYAFWFAVWTFHSVAAARACDALGAALLTPATLVFRWMGADQSAIFFDPISFSGTNGLILGVALYSIYRTVRKRRENGKNMAPADPPRPAARVG